MALTVAELLQAPVMGGAPLLGGAAGRDREVQWTAVIEWQAVGFVHPGELVLTTAVGLEPARLTSFLRELLQSGAAAVGVSLPPDGPVASVPEEAVAEADRLGVALIDIPWEVAFADVSRWAIDELIRRRYAPDSFARALLGGEGMDGIAAALEVALDRPAIVFDGNLQLAGHGPAAVTALTEQGLSDLRLRGAGLSRDALAAATRDVDDEPRPVGGLLGLPPGTAMAVRARHETLGYLYVLEGGEPDLPGLELRALEQAAVAVAMEGLRRRSASDERAREDFLWQLVTGGAGPPDRIVARAALLGFQRTAYELVVGRGSGQLVRAARDLRERATRAAVELVLGVRDDVLVAVAAVAPERAGALRTLVEGAHATAPEVSWGLPGAARPLPELAGAYAEAERALGIGMTIEGPGHIADATALAPYLMLARLGDDPEAMAIARRIVAPLVAYDRSDLVETLDVYLQESANTSSAARRLHLNRHSLLYRLRKIEELTGRSLEVPSDRFVLDLSIKLQRFGVVKVA